MYRSKEDKEFRKGEIVEAYMEINARKDLSEADRNFMLNALTDVVAADKEDEKEM